MRVTVLRVVLVALGVAFLAALLYPMFARERDGKPRICLSNVKNLSMSMLMYVTDYERFPRDRVWADVLEDYVRKPDVLKCDRDDSGKRCSYGMNASLSDRPMANPEGHPELVVIYETAHPGRNPFGGPQDVVSPPRHLGGNNYGFADGHALWSKTVPRFGRK